MQEHACAAAESRPEPSLSVSLKLANVYFAPSALTPSLRPSHDPPRLDSTLTLHTSLPVAARRTCTTRCTHHTPPPSHLNAPSTKSLRATPPRRAPSARRRLRRATS